MVLPCSHDHTATDQISPAIDMLRNLNTQHVDVLQAHGVIPQDYHGRLVFRSAVESIRGTYIASSMTQRHRLVADTLEVLKQKNLISEYQAQGSRQRFDFQVMIASTPMEMAAIEVKGGEGNSVNISERPLWASEFIVWCHLDGAIINQPSHGAASIIFNRIASEMVKRRKQVDAVLFKDAQCNTALRPCPKYLHGASPSELGVAPDVFLMPQEIPTTDNPTPQTHNLNTTKLPARILEAHGVSQAEMEDHIWHVAIRIAKESNGRTARLMGLYHKGNLIESRRSTR
ncbi:MAG: hypothetical protein ABID84_01630 [Chloroflexota bacterium]